MKRPAVITLLMVASMAAAAGILYASLDRGEGAEEVRIRQAESPNLTVAEVVGLVQTYIRTGTNGGVFHSQRLRHTRRVVRTADVVSGLRRGGAAATHAERPVGELSVKRRKARPEETLGQGGRYHRGDVQHRHNLRGRPLGNHYATPVRVDRQ